MSDRAERGRWNRVANITIVVTLAFLLLNPSGVVRRWIGSTYRGWDEQRRVAPDPAPDRLLVPGESTYESSDYPDLADALSFITAGFFLPGTGLALVERTEVHFVDMASAETRVFGRAGGGPREFGRISRALRGPESIALWDILRRRVVWLDHDGGFLGDLSYQAAPFKSSMPVRPVAVHRDGRIVFGDSESKAFSDFRGRTWNPVEYVAVHDEHELEVVARTRGYEHYYGNDRSGGVLFGHRSLMAASADHFIIAETDQEAIRVFRWDGSEVGRIPMPPSARVSANRLREAREYMAAEPARHAELLSKIWSEDEMADVNASPWSMDLWPVNELAPRIDSVFIDFDKRLWVRDYHFTDQDSVTWRVWHMEPATALFRIRLGADERLLDARGDVVLLRRTDEFDVPRAVVSRVVAGNGH